MRQEGESRKLISTSRVEEPEIPMGTAYAVWTGIGAVGTFVVGIVAFGDAASIMRMVSAGLIIAGVIGLKFA